MNKTIVCFACLIIVGVGVQGQTNDTAPATSKPPVYSTDVFPAPPPPPPPPPVISEPEQSSLIPIPAKPPKPPVPPKIKRQPPVVINTTGYDISVHRLKGQQVIMAKKGSESKRIKMKTWNADRKVYEMKYGKLPPMI